jgi:hypothetical protein
VNIIVQNVKLGDFTIVSELMLKLHFVKCIDPCSVAHRYQFCREEGKCLAFLSLMNLRVCPSTLNTQMQQSEELWTTK